MEPGSIVTVALEPWREVRTRDEDKNCYHLLPRFPLACQQWGEGLNSRQPLGWGWAGAGEARALRPILSDLSHLHLPWLAYKYFFLRKQWNEKL